MKAGAIKDLHYIATCDIRKFFQIICTHLIACAILREFSNMICGVNP